MIVGHAAVAFGAKSYRPRIPVALLLVATYFADLAQAWLAWTHLPPVSDAAGHTIPVVLAAAIVLGAVAVAMTRDPVDGLVVFVVTSSHWLLDTITGDKPTTLTGPHVGLCLYNHHLADFVLETAVVGTVWLMVRRRRTTGLAGDGSVYVAMIVAQGIADALGTALRGTCG